MTDSDIGSRYDASKGAVSARQGRAGALKAGEPAEGETSAEPAESLQGLDSSGKAESGRFKDLAARSVSAVVYAALMVAGLVISDEATAVLICALSGICSFEFYRMMRIDAKQPNTQVGVIGAVAYPVAAYFGGRMLVVGVTLVLMAYLLVWYVFSPKIRIADLAITIFGSLYCGLMLSCLVTVRTQVGGLSGGILALGIIVSVWANDVCAYFTGSQFGRHKMVPKISPNKSWEGFFGGLAGSVVIWCLIPIFVSALAWPWAVLCGLVCGLAAVFGDLVESRIKRSCGVKDSGRIMPGHGGMLDRSDSQIFVVFFALVLLYFSGVLVW